MPRVSALLIEIISVLDVEALELPLEMAREVYLHLHSSSQDVEVQGLPPGMAQAKILRLSLLAAHLGLGLGMAQGALLRLA